MESLLFGFGAWVGKWVGMNSIYVYKWLYAMGVWLSGKASERPFAREQTSLQQINMSLWI